jgi:hypothetical protein
VVCTQGIQLLLHIITVCMLSIFLLLLLLLLLLWVAVRAQGRAAGSSG